MSCCLNGSFLELLHQGVFFVVVSRGLFWFCCFKSTFFGAVAGIGVGGILSVVVILISSNPLGLSTATVHEWIATLNL